MPSAWCASCGSPTNKTLMSGRLLFGHQRQTETGRLIYPELQSRDQNLSRSRRL